ncbi:MAG: hypothetical protein LKM43_00305 [Wolbachia endosymbiont of Penenirmus auritus]|nr:hypothetical protein [Wolbachia endosymbiont of Penenirmus auritus]
MVSMGLRVTRVTRTAKVNLGRNGMGRYTFRIDNKDPVYKKLIKVPTAYYRLQSNSNGYTIHSHLGMAELGGMHDVKLKQEDDKIVLYKGNLPLKLNGKDFVIKQEDIIGKNRNNIIRELESKKVIKTLLEDITDNPYFGIGLRISRHDQEYGVLKFIDFYDENDQVLQKIKEKEGGLYFTVENDNIYISDKDGNLLPAYDGYQYQYTQNTCDVLTIGEIISLIKASDAQKDTIDNLKKTTDAQAGIIDELTRTKDAQKDTIDNLKKANNAQQNFALQKGEKLLDDVYEANIVLNDKTIATLPKIGYYTLNDQLVVHNHVTREKVVIPEEFHYLKVVRLGSGFGDGDYKLTFCNVLGNEFFEYKKYDPEYSRVPDEYKFISLSHAKKEYNPNLSELISHQPLFFIKKGPAEPGSDKYAAAVFELTHNGKGKKIATLIDEFGYFDQNGMFKHCNYHEETKCRSYTSAEIDKEYQVTDADSEFYLTEHDNVIIHTIPEL